MDKTIKILKVSLLALVFTAGVLSLVAVVPLVYALFFGAVGAILN